MEHKPDVVRIDDLDGLDLLLQFRGPRPFVALKTILDVFGGKGVAVVECDALPQLEIVGQPVLALAPAGREAGRHPPVGHGFHQCIVERVEAHIGGGQRQGLPRIKPRRRQGDVHRPRHLPRGCAFLRHGTVPGWPPVPGRPCRRTTQGMLEKPTARPCLLPMGPRRHIPSSFRDISHV